jgi:hypothetical protein
MSLYDTFIYAFSERISMYNDGSTSFLWQWFLLSFSFSEQCHCSLGCGFSFSSFYTAQTTVWSCTFLLTIAILKSSHCLTFWNFCMCWLDTYNYEHGSCLLLWVPLTFFLFQKYNFSGWLCAISGIVGT